MRQDEGCYNWQHIKWWFPLYEIMLQTGKFVTEATYCFDIVDSNHESPFKDCYASNTVIHYIQHSPVLAPSCQSQTHEDFVIAQVWQEKLHNAQDPETECLQADIMPGPTNDNDKEYFRQTKLITDIRIL
jgi:hypothetical protein